MKITIFKTLFDTNVPYHVPFKKALDRIREGKSKDIVDKIRNESVKEKRNEIKTKLPAILFSGIFSERNKNGLEKHSGLMVIDFDNFENEEVYEKMFNQLKSNPHIIAAFRSPGGCGIKAVVKINVCDSETHTRIFKSFEKEFAYGYFDKSNSDVSRVCFESYDPDLYHNANAETYSPKLEDKGYSVSEKVVYTPLTDEDAIITKIMGWNWSKDFIKGQRNDFAYVLSRSFCEYGVSQSGAIDFIINHYSENDFSEKEIKNTVKSAYRSSEFLVKKFEDYKKKDKFENDLKFKNKKQFQEEYGIDNDDYEKIKKDLTVNEFWFYDVNSKGEEKIKIEIYKFKRFLEKSGFKKTYLNDSNRPTFVKVDSNIVEETSVEKIKDFVLNYLLRKNKIREWKYFASYGSLFSDTYLLMLESIDLMMLEDTKRKSYIAFENGILEVEKDNTTMVDYIDIDGYIWKSHIIQRNFKKTSSNDNDYKKFIKNISHESVDPLECTIGYLLSGYKNKMNNKAIIFNDEQISDNPEGGTGKGLIMQGVQQIRNTAILDGKTFDDKKSFPYQTVSKDTAILVFDDVKKNWDFESKFSLVTEGITLERKNKDAIKLSVGESPKLVVSTNYVIKGSGNSHERRRHEIEIAQYYNRDKTPFDDFEKELFDDWNEQDFLYFDNYMVSCLKKYLSIGLVAQKGAKNIEVRKFIAETNKEFYEWCIEGNLPVNVRVYRSDKYSDFIQDYPDYGAGRFKMSQKTFKLYLDKWGSFKGYKVNNDKDVSGHYTEFIDENSPEVEEEVMF